MPNGMMMPQIAMRFNGDFRPIFSSTNNPATSENSVKAIATTIKPAKRYLETTPVLLTIVMKTLRGTNIENRSIVSSLAKEKESRLSNIENGEKIAHPTASETAI